MASTGKRKRSDESGDTDVVSSAITINEGAPFVVGIKPSSEAEKKLLLMIKPTHLIKVSTLRLHRVSPVYMLLFRRTC
jgi:hypothetical protein